MYKHYKFYRTLTNFLFFLISSSFLLNELHSQSSLSTTYNVGDIPTSFDNYDDNCNGPLTTLSITLPNGSYYNVLSVDVEYVIQAQGSANRSEQRSKIKFQNNGMEESEVSGVGGPGFQSYSRTLSIANGFYTGGTVLTFEMKAKRTVEITPGCNTSVQKIVNASWIITVNYNSSILNLYTQGCNTDYISLFSLKGDNNNSIYNNSGAYCNATPSGYSDYSYSLPAAEIAKGFSYSGFLKTSNSQSYVSIWIDHNDNFSFENSERILNNLHVDSIKLLYSIYIPTYMNVGSHRMRVRSIKSAATPFYAIHGDSLYTFGEAEDYLVNITNQTPTRAIAQGVPGTITRSSVTTIGESSNNSQLNQTYWVTLIDSMNNLVCGIKGDGNNMGNVWSDYFIHDGPVRQDAGGSFYLDRNISIDFSRPFKTKYKSKFYFLDQELNAIIAKPGSGVTSLFDLAATYIPMGNCESIIGFGYTEIRFPISFTQNLKSIDFENFPTSASLFLHGGSTPLCGGGITSFSDKYFIELITCQSILFDTSRINLWTKNYNAGCNDYSVVDTLQIEMSHGFLFSIDDISYDSSGIVPIPQTGRVIIIKQVENVPWGQICIKKAYPSIFSQNEVKIYIEPILNNADPELAGNYNEVVIKETSIQESNFIFDPLSPCKIIMQVHGAGNNPLIDSVKASVFLHNEIPFQDSFIWVERFYNLSSIENDPNKTALVKLYFKQEEFDNYNNHPYSNDNLPSNINDSIGLSHIKFFKIDDVILDSASIDYSHSVIFEKINDITINFDTIFNAYEISFVADNLSGFIVSGIDYNLYPRIGIGTSNPDSSSVLDIFSNSKGVLIPRMTNQQKLNIVNPTRGLMIYQTNDLKGFYYYNGSIWKLVGGGGSSWTETADANYTFKKVGVNTSIPLTNLHISKKSGQTNQLVIRNTAGNTELGLDSVSISGNITLQPEGNPLKIGVNLIASKYVIGDSLIPLNHSTFSVVTGTDASLSGGGYVVIGDETAKNIVIDNNEIMARDSGMISNLIFQNGGGLTNIGGRMNIEGNIAIEDYSYNTTTSGQYINPSGKSFMKINSTNPIVVYLDPGDYYGHLLIIQNVGEEIYFVPQAASGICNSTFLPALNTNDVIAFVWKPGNEWCSVFLSSN